MTLYTLISPKAEINDHTALPPSTLRIYESSFSESGDVVITLSMIEPDKTLAAGMRIDREQALDLIDALLEITDGVTLDVERGNEYRSGYADGREEGFDHGFEAGVAAAWIEVENQ